MDSNTTIVDMEEIFKQWAWDRYLLSTERLFSRLSRLKYKNAIITLNWDHVKQTSTKPVYKQHSLDKPRQKVIVESEYENETDNDQTHSFRTEQETESTATIYIRKGFRKSVYTEFQMSLPADMLGTEAAGSGTSQPRMTSDNDQKEKQQASASFGATLHVDTEDGNTVRKSLKWTVDTTITSKEGKVTIASLEVDESSFSYSFTTQVKLRGNIIAVIRDLKGKQLLTVEGDVYTVINDMKVKHPRFWRHFDLDEARKTAGVTVEGDVVFRYGVSQRVKIAYADNGEKADNSRYQQTPVTELYPIGREYYGED